MPTKKVGDIPPPCYSWDHDPPKFIVLSPGLYEHTCPDCGRVIKFQVNNPSL